MSTKKSILLLVSGGVAAYKAVTVASKLTQAGIEVHVAMSDSAQNFVTPLTFSSVINKDVITTLFAESAETKEEIFPHLYPATDVDACCIVPATANIIGKIANGIGDELLSTCALSLPDHSFRYICPAMNVEMWEQSIVQENVERLSKHNWNMIGPDAGTLACGMTGYGRLSEPETIIDTILTDLKHRDKLSGKRVLILSGPTAEHFDAVRYLTNHSSGRMGRAVADAAIKAGADVDFITGPVEYINLPKSPRINLEKVQSAEQLYQAAKAKHKAADIVIFVAAVADYRPEETADHKLSKKADGISIKLIPNTDIAASLGKTKAAKQIHIGFAMQTHDGLENARRKISSKNFDAILLNGLDSFAAEKGNYSLVTEDSEEDLGIVDKRHCADVLINYISEASKS